MLADWRQLLDWEVLDDSDGPDAHDIARLWSMCMPQRCTTGQITIHVIFHV